MVSLFGPLVFMLGVLLAAIGVFGKVSKLQRFGGYLLAIGTFVSVMDIVSSRRI